MSANRRKKIGIYSGSFNPVHNGHISLAKYLLDSDIVDEVWIVVSPLNPLKTTSDELIADELRLQMAKIAFEGIRDTKVSDVEFRLPRPSYTIDTLNYLQKQYPDYQFFLLIGEDNMAVFDKWKNYQEILRKYTVLVYPRHADTNSSDNMLRHTNIHKIDAPYIDISSTDIRHRIRQHLPLTDVLPKSVIDFIKSNGLYDN